MIKSLYMQWIFTCCMFMVNALSFSEPKKILVFGGKTGWIGQKIVTLIKELGYIPIIAQSRLEHRNDISNEIVSVKPDYIINAAGITGRPNVDWCEDHKQQTMRVNVLGILNVIDVAFMHNIHVTNIATGCIYQYDEKHPLASGIGFTEEDEPNFKGSFYSSTKILSEKLITHYPNVLHLRLRMPISADLSPRGFIGKIIKYKKLVNIPNSMAVLEDLLPIVVDMTLKEHKGFYNFVNPGTISHNDIISLYIQYVNPHHQYENFTLEQQAQILKAGRSNCELDVSKLLKLYPEIPHIKESIVHVFEKIQQENLL